MMTHISTQKMMHQTFCEVNSLYHLCFSLCIQIEDRMWTLCTLHIGCYDGEEFGASTMQLLQALHLHNIRKCKCLFRLKQICFPPRHWPYLCWAQLRCCKTTTYSRFFSLPFRMQVFDCHGGCFIFQFVW